MCGEYALNRASLENAGKKELADVVCVNEQEPERALVRISLPANPAKQKRIYTVGDISRPPSAALLVF